MTSKRVPLVVVGALGRLGRALCQEALKDPCVWIKAGIDRRYPDEGSLVNIPMARSLEEVLERQDVILDASSPDGLLSRLKCACQREASYVLAVTGLEAEEEGAILEACKTLPLLKAPNLSLGVAVLQRITGLVSSLVPKYGAEIVETHHATKKDSPSGTSLALRKSILDARGRQEKVEIHSVREGEVVGEHEVIFLGPGERIELRHLALSREIFARGALLAARFIAGQKSGLYSMQDVLRAEGESLVETD